jgi:hypothetical protein
MLVYVGEFYVYTFSSLLPFGYPIKGYFPNQELLQIHGFNNSFKRVCVVLDLLQKIVFSEYSAVKTSVLGPE